MNILIIGASSEDSIGTQWKPLLERAGHNVTLASRHRWNDTELQGWHRCNIKEIDSVRDAIHRTKAELVIHMAGHILLPEEKVIAGAIASHVVTKVDGAYNCVAVLERRRKPGRVIIVGGELDASSGNPLSIYGATNQLLGYMTARWQKDFEAGHTRVRVNYLGLPPVIPSTMMNPLLGDVRFTALVQRAISIEECYSRLQQLLA